MKTNFSRVKDFHRAFNQQISTKPQLLDTTTAELRMELIDEEFTELEVAIQQQNIITIADALTDLLYVVYGFGVSAGIDLDACFREVHASNMTKLNSDGTAIYREDGKVLKGENYRAPDLKKVLFS